MSSGLSAFVLAQLHCSTYTRLSPVSGRTNHDSVPEVSIAPGHYRHIGYKLGINKEAFPKLGGLLAISTA